MGQMQFFQHLRKLWPFGLGGSAEPKPEDVAALEALRQKVLTRCSHFRRLLSSNKTALEVMADMEDSLSPLSPASGGHGQRPFSIHFIRSSSARVVTAVFQMVQSLNTLSDNAFADIKPVFMRITRQMNIIAQDKHPPVQGPLVMQLTDVRAHDLPLVGAKMANLGDISSRVSVPDGFVISASAYHNFMEANGLKDAIDQRIQETDMDDLEQVFALSSTIQHHITMARIPQDIQEAVHEAVAALQKRHGEDVRLALRSSAVGEDSLNASFAGQYHTELHVHPDESLDVWRHIIASKYSVTAMSYRYAKGIPDHVVPMCVGVLVMIDASAGGVAYSRDPMQECSADATADLGDTVVVNAVRGLPKAVVDGAFSPDTFFVSRTHPPQLFKSDCVVQPWYYGYDPQKGTVRHTLSEAEGAEPSLSSELAQKVAEITLMLEEYYGLPQDVEWAVVDTPQGQQEIIILQSRPLKIESADAPPEDTAQQSTVQDEERAAIEQSLPPPLWHCDAQGGVVVSRGVGTGPVHIVHKNFDLLSFPDNGILVVARALPQWATVLSRASGLIGEVGGTAGHLAAVAREFGVPAIFGFDNAQSVLDGVETVTIDAHAGKVYAGTHDMPLTAVQSAQSTNTMVGSPVYKILEALAPLVIPLHLLDPTSAQFAPEHCQSLHDITRFCHEKAVELMFPEDIDAATSHAKQLKVGKKLQYWILDMNAGFTEPVHTPTVELSQIQCAPMLALWEGMTRIAWEGPPGMGGGDFMSLMMQSAMNKDIEVTSDSAMAQKNFFIIDAEYMNLQARFGYHFCTIDAHVGPEAHENYVSFQFKGGAAQQDNRRARAQMVARVLESHGFLCDVRQDALFAIAEAYDSKKSLQAVRILGHMLIHTRQVDVIMHYTDVATALEQQLQSQCAQLSV